jgi:hypothetical protein
MKLQDYFKKTLEEMFLHTKYASKGQYQKLLKEHCKGSAKYICEETNKGVKKIVVAFEFDDIVLTYEMKVGGGQSFEKIVSIEYVEKKGE